MISSCRNGDFASRGNIWCKGFMLFLALLLALTQNSCKPTTSDPSIAFYYWKTTFKISPLEDKTLKDLKVTKLYVRYFDLDIDAKTLLTVPLAPITFTHRPEGYNIVPVIFIKNRVLLQSKIDINELALKSISLINKISNLQNLTCEEIQIDCDWSDKSRTNYMNFIEAFKELSHKRLSATIRLHQAKYFLTTGIPNVEHGVLMYYNMGSISTDSTNSIYDPQVAAKYLSALKNYPLEIDIALPIFSWAVQSSENKVVKLLGKMGRSDFERDTNFVAQPNSCFMAKHPNIKNGNYFKRYDRIKIEFITTNNLLEMASDLSENLRKTPKEIIFYDLDSTNIQNISYEARIFEKIAHCF